MLARDVEEIKRLKSRCNQLIGLVKKLQSEKDHVEQELQRVRKSNSAEHLARAPRPSSSGESCSYYEAFVQIIREMVCADEIILPKLATKNSKIFRHVEAAKIKARAAELLRDFNEKDFLNYCFSMGYFQRIGTNPTTAVHRRADEQEAGASVRAYRLTAELVDYIAGGTAND